jgi:hypothetical protein
LVLCPLGSPPSHVETIAFASRHAFFEAELLSMHEVPHRVVVDLQAATGKLGNEPAYGEVAVVVRCDSQTASSPETAFGLRPPIWPGATLPVQRWDAIRVYCSIAFLSLTITPAGSMRDLKSRNFAEASAMT